VLGQLSWDTWHVGWLPSEDIFVVTKEVGEREFLFFRKMGTDHRCFGGIASAQLNGFDVCFFGWNEDARAFG
jgi:hypothetical protein